MKLSGLIVFLLLYSFATLGAGESPDFCLSWTVGNSPWFYEPYYEMNNIGFDTALMLGLDFGGVMIGVEPFCDYTSFNGQDPAKLLQGAAIDFGACFDIFLQPLEWMNIKLGAGGLFQRSLFSYNDSGWLGLNRWGGTAMCDIVFVPFDFLEFSLKNRLDLILATDSGGAVSSVLPNYSAGLRVDVRPGIEWLALFAEANALYWDYTSELRSVQSWMFRAEVGVTLDLRFGDGKNRENDADTIVSGDKTADASSIDSATAEKALEKTEPALVIFGQLKTGVEASFSAIVFVPGKDTLVRESIPVLDRVASILVGNNKVSISIKTYAEYSGDPVLDLELIKIRAEAIRNYFVAKGINESRIKVSLMGQIVNTKSGKSDKPRVIIKILSK